MTETKEEQQTKEREIWDMMVIGAGTAGLTAALYGLRAGNRVLVLEENVQGGQIITTPEIENFPGIPKISGFEYAIALHKQVEDLGMVMVYEKVSEVDFTKPLKVVKTKEHVYYGKTVIIATGVKHRHLEVPGEMRLSAKGVSYCATCDGAFYKGKEVAVVGGGNTALEDALFLAKTSSKVYLIHRRDSFRGEEILAQSVRQQPNIEIRYDTVVEEVLGEKHVEAVKLKQKKTGDIEILPLSGLFIAVGLIPENRLLGDMVQLDEAGYVLAGEDCKTNVAGVFVAGDTRTKPLRQLVTAAADGAVAATEAAKYINQEMQTFSWAEA